MWVSEYLGLVGIMQGNSVAALQVLRLRVVKWGYLCQDAVFLGWICGNFKL